MTLQRGAIALAAITASGSLALAAAPAASARTLNCATIYVGGPDQYGSIEMQHVTVTDISCSQATPVARAFMRSGRAPRGWTLADPGNDLRSTLVRGRERISGDVSG